jgi:hypothetical protein
MAARVKAKLHGPRKHRRPSRKIRLRCANDLNTFATAPRSLECFGLGQLPRHVAGRS